jgi:hypothetical protein
MGLPRWCLHLNVMGKFASFCDPESYAGGSVLLVGPRKPDRSKGRSQKKRHPGPPGWGLGARPTTSLRKKPLIPLKMLNYGKPDGRTIDDQSEYVMGTVSTTNKCDPQGPPHRAAAAYRRHGDLAPSV